MTGKIKIVSGWSNPGGSTHAHVQLCNLLNSGGLDCTFYGPHGWHLDKCRATSLKDLQINSDDVIISHYIGIHPKTRPRKHVYSCHETNLAPTKSLTLNYYDLIHYVSNYQKNWHGVDFPSVIIPNVLPKLKKAPLNTKCAGVIGSIDEHKQTHVSIQRALEDGWERVLVYGGVSDYGYFVEKVTPFMMKGWGVSLMNQCQDKQQMYDSVDCVYHSSKRETFNFVKAECDLTGVEYRGLASASNDAEYWSDDKIFNKWKDVLFQ